MTQQINIHNLESVTRNGDNYTARYCWQEEVEVKHALPVYTGNLKANGTIAKSATLRRVIKSTKQIDGSVDVEISREEARAFCEAAQAQDMILSRSVLDKARWTVYFKE